MTEEEKAVIKAAQRWSGADTAERRTDLRAALRHPVGNYPDEG